ncbi:FAD-dependent thymidylate synthase [Streptomyces thermocarboxydus]
MTDTPADDLKPSFRSDVTVELVKHTASDADVLFAARVSTLGEQSLDELQKDPERSKGLINYLMRDRHGSPFEHNSMTFFVSAPIFVFREFMRHRVGWCLPGMPGSVSAPARTARPSGSRTFTGTGRSVCPTPWDARADSSPARTSWPTPSIWRPGWRKRRAWSTSSSPA